MEQTYVARQKQRYYKESAHMRNDLSYLTNNAERQFNDCYTTTKTLLRGAQSTIKHVIHKES